MDLSIETKANEKRIGEREKKSLKRYLLEKVQTWINALLEAERDEFLRRIEAEFGQRRFTNAADAFDTVKAWALGNK